LGPTFRAKIQNGSRRLIECYFCLILWYSCIYDVKLSPRAKFRANIRNNKRPMGDKLNSRWRLNARLVWCFWRRNCSNATTFPLVSGHVLRRTRAKVFGFFPHNAAAFTYTSTYTRRSRRTGTMKRTILSSLRRVT